MKDCNEGEWRVKHGTNCKSFERCSNGQHETFHCPGMTVWNQDVASCDDPHHVDIHTCTTNNHIANVGSGSGHIPTTTKSSHVAHHSYVHCGDGRCYHGSCNGSHSECQNNHCSSEYKCHCDHGYEGHSCELQKVSENHCQDNKLHCGHGYCVMDITNSTYFCKCNSYYTGKECDLRIVSENHCQDNKLHCGHGYCVMDITDSTYACHCYSDYTGKECDLHIVSGLYCQHYCQQGYCVSGPWSSSSHFCHCYGGYTGSHCDRHIASVSHVSADPTPQVSTSTVHSTTNPTPHGTHCGHDMCYHGKCSPVRYCYNGVCEQYYHDECSCYSDYEGDSCSLKRVSQYNCSNSPSLCNGHCVLDIVHSKYTCRCSSGYTGEFCEFRKIHDFHCQHYGYPCSHGYCVNKVTDSHYFCHCTNGYTGQRCNTPAAASNTTTAAPAATTTSASTPGTSSTSTSPTTTSYLRCKVMTLLDLANQVSVTNPNITSCPSGSFATPEAFVLDHCGVSMPSTWTKGVNVMKECHNIPLYTPVATFINTTYSSRGSLSGVFLGCLPNGFKLGAQQCDALPKILHVENGLFTMNPHLYYTVQ